MLKRLLALVLVLIMALPMAALAEGEGAVTEEQPAPVSRTLQKGMKGEDVLTAQKRLAQLGYYLGELNGEYNDSVVYAVKLMQQKKIEQ